ncbi:MAG TPA: hypothetical protein VF507_04490 [Pyrinomonadaceae bacterium]
MAPRVNAGQRPAPAGEASKRERSVGATAPPISLCAADETVVFSCTTKGAGKLVSLCGSKQLDEKRGYVQYRFGRPGKVEMEFPRTREKTQSAFRLTRYTRPLVTYLALRFESGGYLYSIHQNDNEEEKPPALDASVAVTPLSASGPNTKKAEFSCRMPVKGSLMTLEDVVKRSDEEPLEP